MNKVCHYHFACLDHTSHIYPKCEEAECSLKAAITSLSTAASNAETDGAALYNLEWFNDDSNDVLGPDEMARFYIGVPEASGADESDKIVIIINSGVATLRIEKMIPKGLVSGLNML